MPNVLSCGFIVEDSYGQILACHPTGRGWKEHSFDIPKGHLEVGEDPYGTACRELWEETGIMVLPDDKVTDLGVRSYRPGKDLHLFYLKLDHPLDLKELKCSSKFLTDSGKLLPEMDGFMLTESTDMFFKSLQPVVETCLKEVKNV